MGKDYRASSYKKKSAARGGKVSRYKAPAKKKVERSTLAKKIYTKKKSSSSRKSSSRVTPQQKLKADWQAKIDRGEKVSDSVKKTFGLKEKKQEILIKPSPKFEAMISQLPEAKSGRFFIPQRSSSQIEADRKVALVEDRAARGKIKHEREVADDKKISDAATKKARARTIMIQKAKKSMRESAARSYAQPDYGYSGIDPETALLLKQIAAFEEEERLEHEAALLRRGKLKKRQSLFRRRLYKKPSIPSRIIGQGIPKTENIISEQFGRPTRKRMYGLEIIGTGKEKIIDFEKRVKALLGKK